MNTTYIALQEDAFKELVDQQRQTRELIQSLSLKEYMTGEEVRSLFQRAGRTASDRTLQRWRNTGILGYSKVGDFYLYKRKEVQALIERNYHKPFNPNGQI